MIGSCTVFSPAPQCEHCSSTMLRARSAEYGFTYPYCGQCGDEPTYYRIRKTLGHTTYEFRYNQHGEKLKSLSACHWASMDINEDYHAGTFNKEKYLRRERHLSIMDTFGDLVNEMLPCMDVGEDEREFVMEYMCPYLCDVGLFVICKIHLNDFLRTFRLKGEQRERAERLFDRLLSLVDFNDQKTA